MAHTVRVRVPATSANLGPGYDCAGLALGLFDDLAATPLPEGELQIEISGEGAETIPRDGSHLVVRALARGFAEVNRTLPGLRLECVNRIPHGRGLGSSSAAIVAGLSLAKLLLPEHATAFTDEALVAIATDMEGHPDNVAPAILGGFTLGWSDTYGIGRALRLEPDARIEPVVAIPSTPLATERARQLLPAVVPHRDAAANSGRAALLVEAMTRRPDLLMDATQDLLHQDYRRFAYPQSHALMSVLRHKGIPAMISGAGPTVIALGVAGTEFTASEVVFAIEGALRGLGSQVRTQFQVVELSTSAVGAASG